VTQKGSWSGEMRFRHFKTGLPVPVLYSAFRIDDPETGQPVSVGNVCRDITEHKRTEAEALENDRRYREMQVELAHANRVSTMGQLAASIAHEVSQPFAAMVTNADASLRWLRAGSSHLDKVRQGLTNIVEDGHRDGPKELLISTGRVETSGVSVVVEDSGPGLKPAMLERIFESFYTTKSTGLGLGLSICRSIIEAHGGQLWASTNQRRGATFQFTLPGATDIPS
jgi:C4-dicarboxylate-specific signal transduction histidine kinase